MTEPQDSGGRGDSDDAATDEGADTAKSTTRGPAVTESTDASRTARSGQAVDGEAENDKDAGNAQTSASPAPPEGTAAHTRVPGVAVSAAGFGLDGPRGSVFRDVTFELPAGGLGAIEGQSGSGRTCLLLALTGRMKAGKGHAQVGRNRLPKQIAAVRRISALGPVAGVTDLEPSLTVAEHLRERVLLQQRFGDSLRALLRPRRERAAARKARLDTALEATGLDLESLPKGQRTYVRDLERLEVLRLSVALAVLSRPRLLAVDDLDLKLSEQEREQAWSLLRSLNRTGTTVLAVCAQAPGDAVVIRTGADSSQDSGTATVRSTGGVRGALGVLRPGKRSGAGAQERRTGSEAVTPSGTDTRDNEGDDTAAGKTGGRKTKGEAADALAEARRA